ncbi:neuropeptides B/W receptor type 1 [Manis pentadactyla]|uniref:neuropeptides B/W receptor type 1 n=1 Tax=Manis pentadactyla TaxID=143292 RepID=UPI001876EE79|nr:neuropeptides B/W receptor type 1 [Manis pentadactyla]
MTWGQFWGTRHLSPRTRTSPYSCTWASLTRTLNPALQPPESAQRRARKAAGIAPPGKTSRRSRLRDQSPTGQGWEGVVRSSALAEMPNASSSEPGLACPNASSPQPPPLPPSLAVAVPVAYAVICALGLAGNSAVLYVLLRAPRTHTVTNVFILNLAIADELFTLVLPVNIADFLLQRWPFGELMCKLVVAIDQYNTFSSLYFLVVMSADRYLVVLASAASRRVAGRSCRVARAVSLAVWGLVTLLVLPFAVFARLDDEQGRRQCVLVFPQPEAFWWRASRLYTFVLGFAVPVSTICVLYTTLLCRLHAIRLDSHSKALGRAKKRVTLLVAAILAVCLLCWTPYHLSTVVALTTDLPQTPLVVAVSYFITSLSYANSCLNPFLYAFLDDSFRRSLRQLLACRATA